MNVLMYAAPLNVARVVVATESVEFMPLGLTLGTLACSVSWTTYALLVGDATILAPNVLGDALGVAQVLLYARYARAKPAEAAAADGGGLTSGLLQ